MLLYWSIYKSVPEVPRDGSRPRPRVRPPDDVRLIGAGRFSSNPSLVPRDSVLISDLPALEIALFSLPLAEDLLFAEACAFSSVPNFSSLVVFLRLAGPLASGKRFSSGSTFSPSSAVSLFRLLAVLLPFGSSSSRPSIITLHPSGCLPDTLASASRYSLMMDMSRLLTFAVVRRRGA